MTDNAASPAFDWQHAYDLVERVAHIYADAGDPMDHGEIPATVHHVNLTDSYPPTFDVIHTPENPPSYAASPSSVRQVISDAMAAVEAWDDRTVQAAINSGLLDRRFARTSENPPS